MNKNKWYLVVASLSVLFFSCHKDDNHITPTPPVVTTGVYTLNQGFYSGNNTTLTYYDFSSSVATTDYFKNVNRFGLGDTGSDFMIYGGKIYIVMNNSGYVAVANSLSAKFADTINFKNGGQNLGPENIVAAGSHVFVSCTNGTVAVIDTTTLTITKFIPVGSNPAQMVISGNTLYVSNTGGISASYDSTVSVIDLTALTETRRITVGINPGSVDTDDAGNIYVACTGDYNAIAPKLVKVNTSTSAITQTANIAVGTLRVYANQLFTTGGYLGAAKVGLLNTTDLSEVRSSFIIDGTVITNPYGLDVDPNTGDVYVGDAKDYVSSGAVFCFDKTGTKKFTFSVTPGISPIRTALIRQ